MTYEDLPSQAFNDPRNVTVGKARVIWALPGHLDAGWVLWGGHRTTNRMEVMSLARSLDKLSEGVQQWSL